MSMILGGYVIDADLQRHQIPAVTDLNDSIVDENLLNLKEGNGVLGLRIQPEPETGPYELMLYADEGNLLLMLNEMDEDGDTNVRTLTVSGVENELMSILGESYPAKAVTRDFELVSSIFKDFLHAGNISTDVMS